MAVQHKGLIYAASIVLLFGLLAAVGVVATYMMFFQEDSAVPGIPTEATEAVESETARRPKLPVPSGSASATQLGVKTPAPETAEASAALPDTKARAKEARPTPSRSSAKKTSGPSTKKKRTQAPKPSSGNPLKTSGGFYHPYPWTLNKYADEIEASGNAKGAASIRALASLQTTRWLTGRASDTDELAQMLTGGVKDVGAKSGNKMPSVVMYNIPHRDCGSYSGGGAADAAAYRAWVNKVSRTIGKSKVAVIVEPDALHVTRCLSASQQQERWQLINYATKTLKQNNPNAITYISTSTTWEDQPEMVRRLKASGIANTRGFALNVSGFQTTSRNIRHGNSLVKALGGGYHFVVDTSRNGSGPYAKSGEAAWCNPPGRTVGEKPTTETSHKNVDAYLWIKDQTTDGACVNSNPVSNPAEYTLQIAQKSGY